MGEDEALIIQIADCDMVAFRKFYALFQSKIYNSCFAYLKSREEAEEAVQDVFLEVYHSAKGFRKDSSASTWVYRIAVNKCLDRIRHNKRKKRFGAMITLFNRDTGRLNYDKPDFEHPGVLFENKEKASVLFSALEKLPENQRTAFILKQVEGLSQKEIAAIMTMGEKATESLLQRAKGNLRKFLGDYYDTNEGKTKK